MFGKPITEDTRKKLIDSHKGKKQSPETIEKRASQMRGENHPAWKGGKITSTCQECGKEFKIRRSEADTARFCSRACQALWRSKHLVGEKAPQWKGAKLQRNVRSAEKIFRYFHSKKKGHGSVHVPAKGYGCQKTLLENPIHCMEDQ